MARLRGSELHHARRHSEFKVLRRDLTHDKKACVKVDMIFGNFEVLNADIEVEAL